MRRVLVFALLFIIPVFVIPVILAAQEGATPSAEAASGHAEEAVEHGESHEGQMAGEIYWKWANFFLLAVVLGYLIGKYAGPFFSSRTQEIQQGIRDAAAMRADAEARAAAIEARIGNLAGEVEDMRRNSKEEVSAETARLQAETEKQIAKIQARAEQEIAAAAKNATQQLKEYSAELAMELAEQQIRNRMTPETQDELVEGFVTDLQRKAALN
ncbi:MAG: hypothetical protein ACRD7E_10020 [Bryobacteraceae bacterium]